ncbi:NF-kappa-B inhibitor cactus [Drosophila hydei]|uniref:NF-kappa-B inhibitor cactus n=1 Tax=Drosophila hydei TaxID=7224 RepID=A0A6J1MEJ5_DROHY|nr:NF-kappa-B inhibitor cactus [Drosophila hydei]
MWNQTTTAATSENNKAKETVEDCSCAAGGVASAATAVSVEQQQQRAALEANSKQAAATTTSSFGGKSSEQQQQQSSEAAINKHKEFAAQSETSDSGFISGPQSAQIFSGEISDDETGQQEEKEKESEQDKRQDQGQEQKSDKLQTVLDSGIIDELEEEEHEEEKEQTTTTNQREAGVEQPASEQMRFKHNVDTGIPQWTVQSSLGMNNLNISAATNANSSAGRRSAPQTTTTTSTVTNAAGNTANATAPLSNTSNNINIMNAWEQFYQQNDDGDTPLHLACISGYVDVVAALIRMAPHPCLLNIQNDVAQTPLHLAALTAQPTILRMLLLAGAEPTVRDRHGNTALHLSCIAGEKQCVRALTEKFGASEIHEAHRQYGHRSNDKAVSSLSYAHLPADLEIRNYDGERCVHLAAGAGHIDILRILVSHGADINAREGKGGRTPLHIAIECCNEDLANFLLDECEKLNLETATYAGLTAYQVASILNKSRMQNILEKRGAETLTPPDSDYDSSDIEDLDDTKIFGDPRYFVSYSGGNPMTVA